MTTKAHKSALARKSRCFGYPFPLSPQTRPITGRFGVRSGVPSEAVRTRRARSARSTPDEIPNVRRAFPLRSRSRCTCGGEG